MKPRRSATRFIDTAPRPSPSASSMPLSTMRSRLSPSLRRAAELLAPPEPLQSGRWSVAHRSSTFAVSSIHEKYLTSTVYHIYSACTTYTSRRRTPLEAEDQPLGGGTIGRRGADLGVRNDDDGDLCGGPGQDLRLAPGPRRARPDGREPARSTASSGRTGPARRPRCASCSDCCTRTPGRRRSWGWTPGATRPRCTAVSRSCPAT